MSGVFLSYSRGDRDFANAIIRGLRSVGVSVWWDEDMHSIDWNKELERQIVELATVVVLWTPGSVNSDNVKDEARLGLENSKLINITLGLPKPPYPYDRVNGLPLDDWKEHEANSAWTRLVQSIEEKVVTAGGATKGEFTGALKRREEALKQRHQALARAQEALEEAQVREAETTEAAQIAAATFTRAEEQHVRVMEMRATHLIMSAAAQEYEAARAAKEDADRAMRAAKAEVKGATREVALARAALESPEAGQKPQVAAPPVTKTADKAPEAASPPTPVIAPPPEPAPPPAPKAAEPAPPPAPKAIEPAPAPKAIEPAPPPAPAPRLAPAPAPAAAPAPKPAPAPVAATAPEAPRASSRNLIFGGAAVVLAGAAGAGLMLLNQHHAPATPPAAAPAAAPAKAAASAPAPVDAKAAAIAAAGAIAGKYAPEGLTCDNPVIIAIKDGAVVMSVAGTNSTAAVQPGAAAGEVNATADNGDKYVYKPGPAGALAMDGPGGQSMKLTKCPG
jgi:hypothetical protein